MAQQPEFYYNIATEQVEEGRQSHGADLMGPYPSREAAQNALRTASARNEAWEEADEEWEDWGEPPADAPGSGARSS